MKTIYDLWSTVASDPVTLAAALMMAAAVLALVLIATPTRGTSANAPQRRPAQARSLAAHGTKPDEIARRTGLSRDAVALVLGATSPADARKGKPVAARFSPVPAGKTSPDARPSAR
ncbi:MAG: hypothetical protein U0132_06790 [Gemmatimonadaceae bacterium]